MLSSREMDVRFKRQCRREPIGARLCHKGGSVFVRSVKPNSPASTFLAIHDQIIALRMNSSWDENGRCPDKDPADITVTVRRPNHPKKELSMSDGFLPYADDLKELKVSLK